MDKNQAHEMINLFMNCSKILKMDTKKNFPDTKTHSMSMLLVMRYLFEMGPSTLTGLCEGVGLASSTVSNIIDRAERLGYVKKTESQDDRRSIIISFTEKAFNMSNIFFDNVENSLQKLLADAADGDIEIIIQGLRKFCLLASDNN